MISGKDITKESQNDLKDNLSFFNTFLLIFGVVALLVGSFIIFNTFSIIVAQRSRELALLRAIGAGQRQVLGSVLFEAVLVGLVASIVGFVGGIFLAVGLKALLGALGLDIPASSIVIPASAVIWSFVTGMIVTVVAAMLPGVARVADPADRRDARLQRSTAPARRRAAPCSASSSRSSGSALLLLGLFGDSGLIYVGVGMARRVPRRRGARADHRRADQRRARHPDPEDQGRHRSDRPRERDAQPEAHVGHRGRAHDRRRARRAHHRVRRVGPHVGQRRASTGR